WRLIVDESTGEVRVTEDEPTTEDLRALHKAIAGVREDYDGLRFNTAGAKLIELCNYLTKHYGAEGTPRALAEPLVLMLAPLCPHICEELWSKLGHDTSLVHGPFPEADEQYLVDDTVDYPIQVNGKVRSRMTVPADASEDQLKEAALADEKIAALLEGQEPRKVIVVPGRLVNVVKEEAEAPPAPVARGAVRPTPATRPGPVGPVNADVSGTPASLRWLRRTRMVDRSSPDRVISRNLSDCCCALLHLLRDSCRMNVGTGRRYSRSRTRERDGRRGAGRQRLARFAGTRRAGAAPARPASRALTSAGLRSTRPAQRALCQGVRYAQWPGCGGFGERRPDRSGRPSSASRR